MNVKCCTTLLLSLLKCSGKLNASLSSCVRRTYSTKHYHPEWKRQRREKFLKIDLPDMQQYYALARQELTPGEIRALSKKMGVIPYRSTESTISLACSDDILDNYIPSKDQLTRSSYIEKGKGVTEDVWKKGTKVRALRALQREDASFDKHLFPEIAQQLYIDAHLLLQKVFPRNFLNEFHKDEDLWKLHDLVTEYGWPLITQGLSNKTLIWKFVESLEPPEICNVTCKPSKTDHSKYGQITVRFHSKQIMALYDRFGRLVYGSETVPKDVLEFVVFEKHVSDDMGKWRLHAKLKPSGFQPQHEALQTAIYPSDEVELDEEEGTNTST